MAEKDISLVDKYWNKLCIPTYLQDDQVNVNSLLFDLTDTVVRDIRNIRPIARGQSKRPFRCGRAITPNATLEDLMSILLDVRVVFNALYRINIIFLTDSSIYLP